MKHFLNYFLCVAMIVTGCDSGDVKPVDIGLNYFPLKTGTYQIYNVDEVIYSEVEPVKNLVYQLKVAVMDSFRNAEGTYTYVLNRSKRADENAVWENLDTWSVRGNDHELVLSEGNIAFVKLTFPVREGDVWNGNRFNSLEEDTYEIVNVDGPFEAGGTTFEKTLAVSQETNDDVIVFQDQRKEIYAREVGLIYKEIIQLNYCTDNDCIGQQQIKSGTIYKQEIAEYGKE